MESNREGREVDNTKGRETDLPASRMSTAIAAGVLGLTTLLVLATYATRPQRPRDLVDRVIVAVDADAYGSNMRLGEGMWRRASMAEVAGVDSLAEDLAWSSARAFDRAAAGAIEPRLRISANDRAADAYLWLGWEYLERGRGRALGLGREPRALEAAERVASCVARLAPTGRRERINAFLVTLEEILDRPPEGRCPR